MCSAWAPYLLLEHFQFRREALVPAVQLLSSPRPDRKSRSPPTLTRRKFNAWDGCRFGTLSSPRIVAGSRFPGAGIAKLAWRSQKIEDRRRRTQNWRGRGSDIGTSTRRRCENVGAERRIASDESFLRARHRVTGRRGGKENRKMRCRRGTPGRSTQGGSLRQLEFHLARIVGGSTPRGSQPFQGALVVSTVILEGVRRAG
jgi:hypothetical protein